MGLKRCARRCAHAPVYKKGWPCLERSEKVPYLRFSCEIELIHVNTIPGKFMCSEQAENGA
jgi:hypothetical protein